MRGAAGMGVLEKITRDYWRAVQRLRPMRLPFVKQLVILADVEVIYRRERAAKRGALLAQLPTETDIAGNK